MPETIVESEFPRKLKFLFQSHRYKVLYGGRGGLKSWQIARAHILTAMQRPWRVLCCRELMLSLEESVHELIGNQIQLLGLEDSWVIEKGRIFTKDGRSEFAFSGLRNAANLKSYEDFDCAWIEEAANVSKRSWDILIPTIRKPGSEIWVSFNPELDTDETYKRFVLHPPTGAMVVKTSWRDNRWLSKELRQEIDDCQRNRPDDFLWIYEGHTKATMDGAIYADELRTLTAAGRITSVPWTPGKAVEVFYDLGIADQTAMWFVQCIGFEWRFIDFLQDRNKAWPYYMKQLQERPYVYGYQWLPHDGKRRDLGTGKSIEQHTREAGYKVKIVPSVGFKNGLDAGRNLFARAWFDAQKCADGLNCLRRYRWKVDPDTGIYSREPVHDDNSNGADAYRMAGVGLTEPMGDKPPAKKRPTSTSPWS